MLRHIRKNKTVNKEETAIKEDFYRGRLFLLKNDIELILNSEESYVFCVPKNPPLSSDLNRHLYSATECASFIVKDLSSEGFFARQNAEKIFICWNPKLYPDLLRKWPHGPTPDMTAFEDSSDEVSEEDEMERSTKPPTNKDKAPTVGIEEIRPSIPTEELTIAPTTPNFVELDGSAFTDRARLSEYLSKEY